MRVIVMITMMCNYYYRYSLVFGLVPSLCLIPSGLQRCLFVGSNVVTRCCSNNNNARAGVASTEGQHQYSVLRRFVKVCQRPYDRRTEKFVFTPADQSAIIESVHACRRSVSKSEGHLCGRLCRWHDHRQDFSIGQAKEANESQSKRMVVSLPDESSDADQLGMLTCGDTTCCKTAVLVSR